MQRPTPRRAAAERAGTPGRMGAAGAFMWDSAERTRAAARHGGRAEAVAECRLRGASMAGAIPPGSRIRIAVAGAEPAAGDVVAFRRGQQVVVHRVVALRRRAGEDYLITRGDARVLCDAPVRMGEVLGRVLAFDDGSGWAQVGPRRAAPRRERWVAAALQRAVALALAIGPGLAAALAARLEAIGLRHGWSRACLYRGARR